jgi:hypothetical protein
MKLIDEQYMKRPVCGSRSMRDHLEKQGHKVNRKRVQRLMRLKGLEAIYPKPKTSKAHPAGFIPTCSRGWTSTVRTWFGQPISRSFPSDGDLCIW